MGHSQMQFEEVTREKPQGFDLYRGNSPGRNPSSHRFEFGD